MTINFDRIKKKFIVDTGSPVTILPTGKKIKKDENMLRIKRKYQDVNKNEVTFAETITVESESRGIRENLPMLITKRKDIKSLNGMNWARKFNWMIRNIESTTTITDQSEQD